MYISASSSLVLIAFGIVFLVFILGGLIAYLDYAFKAGKLKIPYTLQGTTDPITTTVDRMLTSKRYTAVLPGSFILKVFEQQLQVRNIKYRLISGKEAASFGFDEKIVLYEVVYKKELFLIQLDLYKHKAAEMIYVSPLTPYTGKDGNVEVVMEAYAHIATQNCDVDCQAELMQLLNDCIDEATFEIKPKPRIIPPATVYSVHVGPNNVLELVPTQVKYNPIESRLLDVSYPTTILKHAGVDYRPPFSLVYPRLLSLIESGKNGSIIGPTGSGKTTLLMNLVASAAERKVSVFRLTYDVLTNMSPGLFDTLVAKCYNAARVTGASSVLFIIDQGKAAAKQNPATEMIMERLRDFLDGYAPEGMKRSIIMSITSEDSSALDEEITRDGRMHFQVTIGRLSAPQASALSKEIEKTTDLVYHPNSFPTKFPTTVAAVWRAFSPKGEPAFDEIFKEYKVSNIKVEMP